MSWNWTLNDALRIHDQAVYDWLGGMKVDYGSISGTPFPSNTILRVVASPEIAFARMADILIRKGWIQRPTHQQQLTAAEAYKIVPLPIISIYRQDPEQNFERAGVPLEWRKFTYNKDTGKFDNHPYPGAYTTNYQIDIWCMKKFTEAHLIEWIQSQFGRLGAAPNEMMLRVNHPLPWGPKIQGMKIESFVDNTDLEPIEAEHRYLRHTFTFSLFTLVFRPPEEGAKPVFRVNSNYRNANTIDNKYDFEGMDLETTTHARHKLDGGKIPDWLVLASYDHSPLTTMQKSVLTSDGRINSFTGNSQNGTYGCFKVNFPVNSAYILDEALRLPSTRNLMAIRFIYRATADCFFAITDGAGLHTQQWSLPRTDRWTQFECFGALGQLMGVRWGKSIAAPATLYLDYINIEFVSAGPIIPPTYYAVESGQRVARFDNLDWKRPYIISGDLLNASFDYDIVVGDADANPLLTTRIRTVSGQWYNFASVRQPSDTGSVRVVLETNPAAIPNLEAREYSGFLRGNFVEIK